MLIFSNFIKGYVSGVLIRGTFLPIRERLKSSSSQLQSPTEEKIVNFLFTDRLISSFVEDVGLV
jgi:hypothetical protein